MLAATPILNRELVAFLRRRRAFLALLGYLVVLCFSAHLFWAEASHSGGANGRSDAVRRLFQFCSYGQIVACVLVAILLSSHQISSERRKKTLDALITSPLRAYEILIGKTLASVGFVFLLALAAIPIYSLCFLFGGVGWTELLLTFYLTLLTGVTYGMVGVAGSAVPPRKAKKNQTGEGFGVIVLLNGLLAALLFPLLYLVFSVPAETAGPVSGATFFVLSPFATYYAITSGSALVAWLPAGQWTLLLAHTTAQAAIFFLFMWIGCRRLRKDAVVAVPHAAPQGPGKTRDSSRAGRQWPFPVPDYLNPVAAKDIRLLQPKGRWIRLAMSLLGIGLFLVLSWMIVISRHELAAMAEAAMAFDIAMLIGIGIAVLGVFGHSVSSVVSESEQGTQSLLAITSLTPKQIVRGKLLSAVIGLAGALSLFYVALAVVYCACHVRIIPHVLVTIPVYMAGLIASSALYGAFGVYLSASSPTQNSAATKSVLLFLLVLFLGFPALRILAAVFGESAFVFVAAVLFPAIFVVLPDEALRDTGDWNRWLLFLFGVAVSLALAATWLRLAGRHFEKRVRREQEKRSAAR